jgi:hypothetical protein
MTDTHFIKLQGKANIPEPLEIDKGYQVIASVAITKTLKSSNNNGEFNVTYVAEPYSIEIVKETGSRVKAGDPRRNSQKIRNMLWKEYANEGYTEDFDDVYDQAAWIIAGMAPGIVREAVKRLQK